MFPDTNPHLIINVDPVGPGKSAEEVLDVVSKYFPDYTSRCPESPNFPTAFKWAWSSIKPDTEYVFHLEDDWLLNERIDVDEMIALMERADLGGLRLTWKPTKEYKAKTFNRFFDWNEQEQFFECPQEEADQQGICGHPTLFDAELIRLIAPFLDEVSNPEKHMHNNRYIRALVLQYHFGIFAKQNQPRTITELGEKWRLHCGWKKAGIRAFFTHWVRTED